MKRYTIILGLFCVIVFSMILPVMVYAQETTLRTAVPPNHTLRLIIEGEGSVTIDRSRYSRSMDISMQRHSEPSVQVQAARGYSVRSVAYKHENITHLFNSGKWTMPKVESDITLSVVFVRDSGNPPTGDTFNPWIIVLFILSLLGLLVCVLKVRKHKLI